MAINISPFVYTPRLPFQQGGQIVKYDDKGLGGLISAGIRGWQEGQDRARKQQFEDEAVARQKELDAQNARTREIQDRLSEQQIEKIRRDMQSGLPNELFRYGYTPEETRQILDIRYGLKPRASAQSQRTPEQDLDFWTNVYRKSKYDPVWGEGIRELEDISGMALEQINNAKTRIGQRQSMGNQQGLNPQQADQQYGNPATNAGVGTAIVGATGAALPDNIQNNFARKGLGQLGSEVAPEQTEALLRDYPNLSLRLPGMTPQDRQEVMSAIADGMTEDEILQFIR